MVGIHISSSRFGGGASDERETRVELSQLVVGPSEQASGGMSAGGLGLQTASDPEAYPDPLVNISTPAVGLG